MAIKHSKTAPADDGSAEINAAEWNAAHTIENDSIGASQTQEGSARILSGLDAGKPTASISGRFYWATDTKILYRDTGTVWEETGRGETVTRLAQLSEKSHASLTNVTADQHHAQLHASSHVIGGTDALSVGVPVNIGTANSEGTATNFARRDHVHAHPSGLGTDLHHPQLHNTSHKRSGGDPIVRHGVIVDPAGYGDYTAIQDAINSLS